MVYINIHLLAVDVERWKVDITSEAKGELKELLRQGAVTNADISVLLRWVREMEEFGPDYIARSHEWHDHELEREWSGFRSSSFSSAGRVIYKIVENRILIEVYRVTTDHDYRR